MPTTSTLVAILALTAAFVVVPAIAAEADCDDDTTTTTGTTTAVRNTIVQSDSRTNRARRSIDRTAPYPVSVNIRVDDNFRLFQNGLALTATQAKGYRTWHTFALDRRGGVLAVEGQNTGGFAGIAAVITYSNGHKHWAASGWKCSKKKMGVTSTDWMRKRNYQNSKFKNAVYRGSRANGATGGQRPEWFWTKHNSDWIVFCRYEL